MRLVVSLTDQPDPFDLAGLQAWMLRAACA